MFREVDNFEVFANKLFERPMSEDEFYFVQILVRGKDGLHVSGNNKNRLVKYYTVTSKEMLLSLKQEIIGISKAVTGRVYISPQRRSFREVANLALELTTHTYVSQNWIGMRSVFSTSAGKSGIKSDKKYIIDIDNIQDENDPFILQVKERLFEVRGVNGPKTDKLFLQVKTKSGTHLICEPFDTKTFMKSFPQFKEDEFIHKNNPSLLYFSWEE